MTLTGDLFIGGERRQSAETFRAYDPAAGAEIDEAGFYGATEADVAEQRKAWDHYDKRLEALGFKRPTRPRGRPKTEPPPTRVIELDGGEIGWLPNFHKPGTPEHAEYEEAMRRAGKKPGDPS